MDDAKLGSARAGEALFGEVGTDSGESDPDNDTMTNTLTRTERTIIIGDLKLRTFEMDISNYDGDGNGDGESFTPDDPEVQMHRFVHVLADVIDGTTYTAQYDEDAQAVRLLDGGSEVASNSNNSATVRVTALGK